MARYSENEVKALLEKAIAAEGSQSAFAAKHSISRGYLNDVLGGRKEIGQKLLDALGLRQVTEFEGAVFQSKDS